MVLGGTGRRRLPETFSTDAFRLAWRESRDASAYPGAPGVDRTRAAQFASAFADNVQNIREEIRAESFRFNKLRLARVLKESGSYRILAIPTVRDRLVQRVILRHLEADERFEPNSAISYGFAKQRTLADAQRAALGLRNSRPWVLKCDIVRFFDQIPRAQLKSLIHRKVRRKIVSELLSSAVDCELQLQTTEDKDLTTQNGVQIGVGLRQGMPVSPMLSNLLLKGFDERLEKLGIVAVRYADDIAVFTDSRAAAKSALMAIKEGLAELKLEVPDLHENGKTKIYHPTENVEFLGVEIRHQGEKKYKLCAPTKKIEKIEAAMAAMVQIPKCVAEKRTIGQVARALETFTIGHAASMAVLEDGGDFLARLEAAKRKQMLDLLVNLLGKTTVESLSPDHLAILGVKAF